MGIAIGGCGVRIKEAGESSKVSLVCLSFHFCVVYCELLDSSRSKEGLQRCFYKRRTLLQREGSRLALLRAHQGIIMSLDDAHPVFLSRTGVVPIRFTGIMIGEQIIHPPDIRGMAVRLDPPAHAESRLLFVLADDGARQSADIDGLKAEVVLAEDLGVFGLLKDFIGVLASVALRQEEGVLAVDV